MGVKDFIDKISFQKTAYVINNDKLEIEKDQD